MATLTFIQFLEELAGADRAVTVPAGEVERLVGRFGGRVRQMGRWNASGDGALEIPLVVIREAAALVGRHVLADAVEQLKTERPAPGMEASAAESLIVRLAESYNRYFRELMTHYQETSDAPEATRLRDQIVREVFGE